MLGVYSNGRDNNLNLIRMLAASAVVFGHAWPLSMGPGAETALPGMFSSAAVLIFFGISGFLVTQSMDRTRSGETWIAARVLRLFPGLLVVLMLTVFILGPWVTRLPLDSYFSSPQIITYVFRNFTLAFMQYNLPGVFENNPYPIAVNGSLWTLFYEVTCYGIVFLFGYIALKRSHGLKLAFFTTVLLSYVTIQVLSAYGLAHYRAEALTKLAFPFIIGMIFYVWRDRLPLSWPLGFLIAGLAFVCRDTIFTREVYLIALTYWVFLLAYLLGGPIRAYNRLGDYSYGTYIYAFPIQQAATYFFDLSDPWFNIAIALPITLALAILSWHYVEKPFLGKKASFAALLMAFSSPFKNSFTTR